MISFCPFVVSLSLCNLSFMLIVLLFLSRDFLEMSLKKYQAILLNHINDLKEVIMSNSYC